MTVEDVTPESIQSHAGQSHAGQSHAGERQAGESYAGESQVHVVDRRAIVMWEAISFVFIMLVASALHFSYELSNFWRPMAVFGSVNESTWEHLKLFFWPGLVVALVQYAYIRDKANNYWFGKALALLAVPVGVITSFYFYLGIALPIYGRGFLWADISTGAIGVLLGNAVAYYALTREPMRPRMNWVGGAIIVTVTAMMIAFTPAPPEMFLFNNFYGYEYSGEFGILKDYEPYLVFR